TVEALEPVREADLPRLDLETRRRIRRKIEQIREDPHGYGKPLGRELAGLYTVRMGRYRIVYQVREAERLLLLIAIAHREEIYELARLRLA
ncbi:MAG: type II toxin-antitoxin system RelE/ParE family toxin, partial [Candidatus Bipolaricaulia bacterium]